MFEHERQWNTWIEFKFPNSHFSFFLPFFFTSVFFLDKVFFFMKFGNWIIIFLLVFLLVKKKQKRIKQLTNLWVPKSWICCGYEFIGIKNRFLPLGFKWINSEIMKTNDILNANAKCFKTFFLSLRFENDSNLA